MDVNQTILTSRAQLWTPELDKLLTQWKRSIANRKRGHSELSAIYIRRHYWFGVPTTGLGALMSAGILTTFRNNCDQQDDSRRVADEIVRLFMGMLGVISTILAALQTFLDYSARAERHKSALDSYESLYGTISTLLLIPQSIRGDPVDTLRQIRTQFDNISRISPILPTKYNTDLAYTVINPKLGLNQRTPRPPKPEEVDMHSEQITTTPLSALLNDEEDENVCIGIDIEAGVAADQMANAPAALAANLAARNNDIIQRSLYNELAFEMKRLQEHDNLREQPKRKRHSKRKTSV